MNAHKLLSTYTLIVVILSSCVPVSIPPAPASVQKPITVGMVSTIKDLVQAGPIGNLNKVSISKTLYNDDAVSVANGGFAKLNLVNQIYLNLFNDTSVDRVNVEIVDPTINRIRMVIERGGLTGKVPKESGGTDFKIPNGTHIYILGTQFYITYDPAMDSLSAGNFDGTVAYHVPGQSVKFLPAGSLVDIQSQGIVQVSTMSFNIQEFETAAQTAGSPIKGLKNLRSTSKPTPFPVGTITSTLLPTITSTADMLTAPLPSPILACTHPANWVTYIVQRGDNLFRIGLKYGVTIATLQSGNCMGYSSQIYTGQILYVPTVVTGTPSLITITVNKSGTGTVTSNPMGIGCGSICTYNFLYSTSVTLTATASQGYILAGWSGACAGIGIGIGTNVGTCTLTMDAAKSVTANFELNPYPLTVSKNGAGTVTSNPIGIDCGSICTYNFLYNTSVTLTATASQGYILAGWGGACASIGTGIGTNVGTCTLMIDTAKSATANFAPNSYPLTVSRNGAGTVISNPMGINCGSACAYDFQSNALVTLTAIAAPGYSFTGWSGACTGNIVTCTFTMDAAKFVTANFVLITYYPLIVSTSNAYWGGTITSFPIGIDCGSLCTYDFPSNTLVTLTAIAVQGYSFAGWDGACTGIGTGIGSNIGTCMLTMDVAKSVTAIFSYSTLATTTAPPPAVTPTIGVTPIIN